MDDIVCAHSASQYLLAYHGHKHIWTFTEALHEIVNVRPALLCPCTNNIAASATPLPYFVGNDYFRDSVIIIL